MAVDDKVNILLVDDQPAKLLSYETILAELGENLIKAASAREALEQLLKRDIAVILVDVCMPELDGFQLAAMIREHPRFQKTAIIFISAIHLTDVDRLRAYEMGAVDYVPVPVIPEVLRAKVRIFAELYRKTSQLEQLNQELERRVAERTAELEASTARLMQSEERRSLTLAAGQMGSWEWDPVHGDFVWDDGQYRIFGVDPASFEVTVDNIRALIHPEDWKHLQNAIKPACAGHPVVPDRISRLSPEWPVALVHRNRGRERRRDRSHRAHQRRDRRHHRPQGSRGTPGAAGARGRPPGAERIGTGAIDRAPDPLGHHQVLHHGGRWADRSAVAGAHAACPKPLAGRRPRPPGRRGALSLSHGRRRADRGSRARRIARAAHRPDPCARPARALHQCRQVRRAVGDVGPRGADLGVAAGQPRPALDRERRTVHAAAGVAGLRHQGDQRQRRAPARGRGQVRVASGRPALQPGGAPRRQDRAARASRRRASHGRRGQTSAPAAARDRQSRAPGRGRDPGCHDDAGHPDGARILRWWDRSAGSPRPWLRRSTTRSTPASST